MDPTDSSLALPAEVPPITTDEEREATPRPPRPCQVRENSATVVAIGDESVIRALLEISRDL
eukprot:7388653-Prymnesium_polylepis.1